MRRMRPRAGRSSGSAGKSMSLSAVSGSGSRLTIASPASFGPHRCWRSRMATQVILTEALSDAVVKGADEVMALIEDHHLQRVVAGDATVAALLESARRREPEMPFPAGSQREPATLALSHALASSGYSARSAWPLTPRITCWQPRPRSFVPGCRPWCAGLVIRAANLRALGDFKGARELDEDTFRRRLHTLGEEHPDTCESARNLAADLRTRDSREGYPPGLGR